MNALGKNQILSKICLILIVKQIITKSEKRVKYISAIQNKFKPAQ